MQQHQNLIDNVHQFEALFNFATVGIILTNNDGAIINFNRYAETQFGYAKEEILGKKVEVLLPAPAKAKHVHYRDKYYEHPEPRIMGHGRDLFAQNKNGKTFPVEVSLSHYEVNDSTFVIAFVVDITVRKQLEEKGLKQTRALEKVTAEVKEMNAELEQKVEDRTKMLREALMELERSKDELKQALKNEKELNELKSGFVTVASHEFRTPLTTILSCAYLLEKYNEHNQDEKISKQVGRIKSAVGGMKNILEDFLSLGKIEEGLLQTNLEVCTPADMEKMIRHLLRDMDGLIKPGQQINFNNKMQSSVRTDVNLVKNILINLVSNAIKFTKENKTITIDAYTDAKSFVIEVEDNGIGISEEDQKHLFERFFRAKNAISIQGTGLGLHIVNKYLEAMQGSISFKSQLHKGSRFTVHIPQNEAPPL
jgi:PAS domain S-box-containing protein